MAMRKIYLAPRIKTLKITSENVMNMTSVNDSVGDGNQLGKKMEFDDFDTDDDDYTPYEGVWE